MHLVYFILVSVQPLCSLNQITVTAIIPMYGNSAVHGNNTLFRIQMFSILTIKTTRALAALAPLCLLIVRTLTNVL